MTKHAEFGLAVMAATSDPALLAIPYPLLTKQQKKAVHARIHKRRHAGYLGQHYTKQNAISTAMSASSAGYTTRRRARRPMPM